MATADHPIPTILDEDVITHYRRAITGGVLQGLTVEVVSVTDDDGTTHPPTLSVSGDLVLDLDQLSELNEALFRAQYAQLHARRAQLAGQR